MKRGPGRYLGKGAREDHVNKIHHGEEGVRRMFKVGGGVTSHGTRHRIVFGK